MNKEQLEKLLSASPVQMEIIVPGTRIVEGREFCYVSNKNQIKFEILFKKLFECECSVIPESGGVIIEGCKITLPNGEIFEGISYRGDIEGWRQQIKEGAKALNEKLARIDIDTDSIVLDDMQSFCLSDCEIDFDYCIGT